MKKILLATFICAIAPFGANAKTMSESSLTNPLYKPEIGKLYSATNVGYLNSKFNNYNYSTQRSTTVETNSAFAEQVFKFGVKETLTTSFALAYEYKETYLNYNNTSPYTQSTTYLHQGMKNPVFGFEYRFLNSSQKLDLLGSAKFNVLERYDTTNKQSDGTVASGRNEFGLGLRYGKNWNRFTLAGTIMGKYLDNAKYNDINADKSKDSRLDEKHYLVDAKIESEYMFNEKFSMNVNIGYIHEQHRDLHDRTAGNIISVREGERMSSEIQVNYMLNDWYTLSVYYEGEGKRGTYFDLENSVQDYEYRDQITHSTGIKVSAEF